MRVFVVAAILLLTIPSASFAQRNWGVDASGLFSVNSNWLEGSSPSGATVDVFINRPAGVYTITYDLNSGNRQLRSITCAEIFDMAAHTAPPNLEPRGITLSADSVFNNTLIMSGGIFSGNGNITVNGLLDWRGGGGFSQISGQRTVTANGGIRLNQASGARQLTNTRRIINNGNAVFLAGSISNQGIIDNPAGAVFDFQGDGNISEIQGINQFVNAGTVIKSGGPIRSRLATSFFNTGTVNITGGTLTFHAEFLDFFSHTTALTSSGPISVASGGILEFTGTSDGTHRLNAGSIISGAGDVKFTGVHNGTFQEAPTTIFNDTYNVTGKTEFINGRVIFNGPVLSLGSPDLVLPATSGAEFNSNAMTFESVTLGGTIGGSAPISVTGDFQWGSGAGISGPSNQSTLTIGGNLTISGDFPHIATGRTIISNGTATWSGTGAIQAATTHVFDNRGTLDIQNDLNYSKSTGATPLFKNSGTITKSSTGATIFALPFSSSGTIDTGSGTINFTDSLTLTGGVLRGSGPINSTGPFMIQNTVTKDGSGILNISGPQTHPRRAALNLQGGETNLITSAGTAPNTISAAIANLTITVSGPAKLTFGADQYLRNLIVPFANPGSQSVDLNTPNTPGAFRLVHLDPIDLAAAKALVYAAIVNANRAGAADPTDGIYDSGLLTGAHPGSRIGLAALVDAHDDPYLLIRPTRIGDVNLDGQVTIADFIDLASHFNSAGTWQEGDLNYDNFISIADFIDLAANFNTSYSGENWPISVEENALLSNFATSIGAAAVPEPSMMFALGIVAFACKRRRR